MGFSDATVLNLAIYAMTGLVTFNGPALMTDLAEYPKPYPYTVEYLRRAVSTGRPIGPITPATEWTEEFLDWGEKAELDVSKHRFEIVEAAVEAQAKSPF